jgi:hypothetical protein
LRLVDSERYAMEEVAVSEAIIGNLVTDVRPDRHGLGLGSVRDGAVTLVLDDHPVVQPGDVLITLAARDSRR